jgi:UDP-glucose 4-epimerase
MRILVTGGNGFIGGYLCSALQGLEGITVVSMDMNAPIHRPNYILDSNIYYHTRNILSYADLSLDFDIYRPHIVYHLAAKLGVQDVMDNPGTTVSENVLGTLHVATLCKMYNAHLIFASTSDVYGKSLDLPFREDGMLAIGPSVEPRWSYAISKLAGEHLTLANHGTVIRFFNVTGPGQAKKYVVPIMVNQACHEEAITVHADGSSTRCFADVRDVVSALIQFVDLPIEQIGGEIYNIGNDKQISMWELAEVIRQYVNPYAEIVKIPYTSGYTEMPNRIPCLEKIQNLLDGWSCKISLEQTIKDTAAYGIV